MGFAETINHVVSNREGPEPPECQPSRGYFYALDKTLVSAVTLLLQGENLILIHT